MIFYICLLVKKISYEEMQFDKLIFSIFPFSTGMTLSNAMMNAGLTSFKKIEDINARELELVLLL